MAKIKNTGIKPIMLRFAPKKLDEGVVAKENLSKTLIIGFDNAGYEVGDIDKLRENKIVDGYFNDGLLVELKPKKQKAEKSEERIALEAEAEELGLTFPANIKDETLAAKIAEAKGE